MIVRDRFNRKWERSQGPPPQIENIFHVGIPELEASHRGQRFNAYRNRRRGSWRYAFHGTRRYCHIGCGSETERQGRLLVCRNDLCGIYGIINNSFKVNHSARGLFGRGIYTTSSSFKADTFSENHGTSCQLKAMFLCRYVPGRVQYLWHGNLDRTAPCRGYDSVSAVLATQGGSVNFPEAVVYRDDAIVPVAVITYLGY
ncbi:hypothetical protein FSST1_002998 [Fusarium sambucinum]